MTGRVKDIKSLRRNSQADLSLAADEEEGCSEVELREKLRFPFLEMFFMTYEENRLCRKEVQNRDVTIRALQRNYEALASSAEGSFFFVAICVLKGLQEVVSTINVEKMPLIRSVKNCCHESTLLRLIFFQSLSAVLKQMRN